MRPPGARRRTAAHRRIEVQVYLRSPGTPSDSANASVAPITRDALRRQRENALAAPLRTISRFAARHRLEVTEQDPARRLIRLAGTAAAFEAAFKTELYDYQDGEHRFRARSGSLCLPRTLARIVESVLGFTTRRVVSPALGSLGTPSSNGGYSPAAFAALYDFPKMTHSGTGQRIALVQAGGVYYPSDTVEAFAAMGLEAPTVIQVPVPGVDQPPDMTMDRELALDVQVAGATAPGATLLIYVAADGFAGVIDAVSYAVHDEANHPTILSISFGAVESAWGNAALATLNGILNDAARLGMTVVAASGDSLATGGYPGTAQVSYPASDPNVLACGGTMLRNDGAALGEAVWNDGNGNGSGGGISASWPVPSYQAHLSLPADAVTGKQGRGVPDVAAIADRASGCSIRCRGNWLVENGTSAGAPLWAGLIALINAQLGKNVGFVNPTLYASPGAFNDVVHGDNRSGGIGYSAANGWDPCTGLGSPRGSAILALF